MRTLFFVKSIKAFFLLLIILLGTNVWGQSSATYDFGATGAVVGTNETSLDANISFQSFRNSGTVAPAINAGQLRLYQNATKGNSIKIFAKDGVTIIKVVVNASGSDGVGPAGYTVDGGSATNLTISSGSYTINATATDNIEFYNRGSSSSTRTYVDSFTVTYSASSSITTTSPISGAPLCVTSTAGTAISVPYTVSGTFNTGNVFTAQLSNASGSFASAITIGTRTAINAGTINATIPAGTATGTNYKIRVIASNPSITGSETAAFAINLRSSAISPTTVQNIVTGANGSTLTSTATGVTSRQWKYSTTAGGPYNNSIAGATNASYTPSFSTPGTYYVVCEATFAGCGVVTSNAVQINVTEATATLTVSPSTLSGFTYSVSNGPSPSQNFTIMGNTLNGSNVDILLGDDYEISLDNGTTWADYSASPINVPYTGSTISRQISVRLKAGLAAGNYNNSSNHIIVVEGGGVVSGPKLTLSGIVTACVAPTTQSVVAPFTGVGTNAMTVNLTSGNGVGRVVTINTTNSFTNPIISNTLPAANSVYAGSGQQVIYAGTSNSVAVTGLSHSTTYYVRVYEYNICSTNYTYNTTTQTNNPRSQTTLCELPVNPAGEVDLENPYCGSATLVYQHGSAQPQAGVAYYWQTTANGTSTANPVTNTYTVTSGGVYYVRAYNGNCWSAESYPTQAVVISSAAAVSTQPTNQNAVVGATATFTVVGTGSPSYQWQLSTNNGTTWTNISGATSASYTTPMTTLAMNGYRYRVRLSNSCNAVTSNVVVLSVVSGPCLSEGFDSGSTPSGWLATGVSWTEYSDGGSFNANNGTLTSPELSKPSRLTFDLRRTGNATAKTLLVKISTTGQNTGFDTTIATFTHANTTNNGLTSVDIDLSDYSTESKVWIRLEKSSATTAPWRFDNFEVFCAPGCTPATITATPDNGPANTVIVINGSNFTSGSTVKFGTIDADVEYINATQLKATVPASANGNIIVDTALDCDSETAFTLIKQDASGCEVLPNGSGSGNAFASDLIFYEVYDENGGTGGTITIYNGTNAAVNLNDYSFFRSRNVGTDAYEQYGTLSGTVASGELAIIGISGTCTISPTPTNGTISGGFNDNDGFRLMKGSAIVDEVLAPNYVGYYMKRKPTNLSPKSIYDSNDWTTDDVTQCVAGVGSETPAVKTLPPVIVVQPTYTLSCDVVNAALTLTATEGYAGGNALAYQWYVLDNSGIWSAVSNNSNYSGATTANLNIADVAVVDNFQYYCQVRENTQTCYTATAATQIKSAPNTWNTAKVWSNGLPVLGSKVIIEGSYDSQANGALDVCELTINATGTMIVKANSPIKVKKKIINNNSAADSFVVKSDANLIQTDNIANQGNIKVERAVTGMNNVTGNIDYVYWSSPVSNQPIKAFSPNTPNSGFQQYNEPNDKFTVTSDPNFVTGKGYAIRAENVLANGYNKTYSFTGVPQNGDVSTPPLLKSPGADKGYNLIGNPYPSNIDFDQFHALNANKIYASAFFWTNNTYTAQQMGSGYAGNNYAIYNITGGVPATYDKTNPNYSIAPNGKVKVGQAFIVQSKIAGALDFNNSMRVTDNGTFYQKNTAKNRFWLTMTSPNNLVNTILIGYVSGATDAYETDFDGELFAVGSDSFYSVLGARKLAIQGRADQFTPEDVVPVANAFSVNGNYTIALQNPEGLFDGNQQVFLKDKLLNQYINLSTETSYTFSANKGTDATRFEIVYKDQKVLGADEVSKNHFDVYRYGSDYVVQSSKPLGRVDIYDATGRLVISQKTSEKTLKFDGTGLNSGMYIIKAENSGEMKTKKILK